MIRTGRGGGQVKGLLELKVENQRKALVTHTWEEGKDPNDGVESSNSQSLSDSHSIAPTTNLQPQIATTGILGMMQRLQDLSSEKSI